MTSSKCIRSARLVPRESQKQQMQGFDLMRNTCDIRRVLAVLLLVAATNSLAIGNAFATNLNTTPLPREREAKDFQQSNEVVPSVSRFHRRLDYR